MSLADRIREAMGSMSQADFARAVSRTESAVTFWLDGRTKSLKGETAAKIEAATGYSATWLINGKGPKMAGQVSDLDLAPELRGDRRIPVVGEVKGGDDGYLDEMQYPIGHGEGFVEYPTADSSAYALRVRGDSMHPRYRAGEFIVVEPSIEAQSGDDVVVSLTDGRKLLKELNWIRDGEVQLLSVNNHFGPLTIPLSDVNFIQLVAGRVRRSAFHKS